MKTVKIKLRNGKTLSFPKTRTQEKENKKLAIYDESYTVIAEFDVSEIETWWYEEAE